LEGIKDVIAGVARQSLKEKGGLFSFISIGFFRELRLFISISVFSGVEVLSLGLI
jgi:hypothetical protein